MAVGTGDDGKIDFQLYRYLPSLPAAIISLVVFGILTALHTWRLKRVRAFYFSSFTFGGLFQTIGYAGRLWSHFNRYVVAAYSIQAILILVAPALFAASIYMILGRLIRTIRAEHLSLIPVKWLTKVFVLGDVVSFSLQAGGGGIQASGTLQMYHLGEKIIVIGLFIQIAVFGFFIITTILFNYRIAKAPTAIAVHGMVPWKRHIWVLYTTSVIILVRSIFRVIEYLQGNGGYLISHEVFLYTFDMLLMVIVMVIFLIWYIDDLDQKHARRDKELGEQTESNDGMLEELSPCHAGQPHI